MVIGDSFYSKNVKSAVVLGQARSTNHVVWVLNLKLIYMSCTRKIKQSLCRNGSATKEQVQYMVTQILNLKEIPKPIDITDAMAVACALLIIIRLYDLSS